MRGSRTDSQLDVGDAGRDIQTGLALQADRLQRDRRLPDRRPAIAADADADRGIGADAAVAARQVHRVRAARSGALTAQAKSGLLGEAEIEAEPADVAI